MGYYIKSRNISLRRNINSKKQEFQSCSKIFFRGYMKQMIFDSSYLLIPAICLEDLNGSLFI